MPCFTCAFPSPGPCPPQSAFLPSPLHAACTPCGRPPPPQLTCSPHAPHVHLLLQPSAESKQVQPAPQLGHLWGHEHDRDVLCELLPPRTSPLRPFLYTCCVGSAIPPPLQTHTGAHNLPACCLPRSMCHCLQTLAQYADKFNQPLSWDTSGVTDMRWMFNVRGSPRPVCSPPSAVAPYTRCTGVHARSKSPPPSFRLVPTQPPALHHGRPACDPRQGAQAFNQPLSWDTSGVRTMHGMFNVRGSPPPPPPHLQGRGLPRHALCV